METDSQWILLAHILRPQGRKGELLADLFTDFPARFASHPRVWLAPSGFAERVAASTPDATVAKPQPAEVFSHWLPTGRNAGRIVLKLAGIDTIDQAAKLAGNEVVVPLAERMPLPSGSAYIADLIGCTVRDGDRMLGVVAGVQFPTTSDGSRRLDDAAPLLAIASPDAGEILVPFAAAYVVKIDTAAKHIRMNLPEGLTELNRVKPSEPTFPK